MEKPCGIRLAVVLLNYMEENSINTIWKIVLTAVITTLVIGYGTYWYVNSKAATDKAALQSSINSLNKKVADLEKPANTTTPTPSTTTTTDPTANWKTYSNTDLSISFKYPSSLNLLTDNEVQPTAEDTRRWINIELNHDKTRTSIGYDLESCKNRDYFIYPYMATAQNVKPETSVDKVIQTLQANTATISSLSTTKLIVNGKNAVKFSYTLLRDVTGGSKGDVIHGAKILNPSNNESVDINGCESPFDSTEFDSLVSSFKFTK